LAKDHSPSHLFRVCASPLSFPLCCDDVLTPDADILTLFLSSVFLLSSFPLPNSCRKLSPLPPLFNVFSLSARKLTHSSRSSSHHVVNYSGPFNEELNARPPPNLDPLHSLVQSTASPSSASRSSSKKSRRYTRQAVGCLT